MKKNYMNSRSSFRGINRLKKMLLGTFLFLGLNAFSQAVVPFMDDFSTNNWTLENGGEANTWFYGVAAGNPANGLYITNDAGVSNAYTNTSSSIVQAYRDVTFPASTEPFNLKFDWKANGESGYDYLRVWMVPTTATITAGTQISIGNTPGAIQIGANYDQTTNWSSSDIILSATTYSGTTMRLVFEWTNDDSGGTPDPAAVDNLIISVINCGAPTLGVATSTTSVSATLAWTANGSALDFDVEYGLTGFVPTGTPSLSMVSNPTTIPGLTANTSYEYYIRAVCSVLDKSVWAGPFSFYTGYCPVSTLYTGDYTSAFSTTAGATNVTYTASSNPVGSYSNQLTQTLTSFITQQINFSHTYVGGGNGLKIWVDWNSDLDFDDAGEEMFYLANSDATKVGSFAIPGTVANGNYRMRVRSDYGSSASPQACGEVNFGTTIDFTLTIDVAPTCLAPTALTVTSVTSNSAIIGWLENGSATQWDIEYVVSGSTPTGVPSITVTTNPDTISGLLDNTEYDVYVRSVCSPADQSTWSGPISFATQCNAVSATALCENFEGNSPTLNCWSALDENNDGNYWALYTLSPNSGTVSAAIYTDGSGGDNDDYLITPNLTLTGNEVMKFSYQVYSANEPNDFQVLLSTTGSSPADFTDTIMALGQYSNITYKDTVLDLSAYTGNVYIAFHVPAGGLDGWYLFIDDVCFDICTPTAGTSGSQTVCSLDQTLDLNTVITQGETNGVWTYNPNPSALTGSNVNLTSLPFGTSTFSYVVTTGCTSDTTIATITVAQPSSAGSDGALAVCRNQPFNLLSGLTGSANLGGVWTNPNAVVVPNGNAVASNIPGQYNYKYIVNNGVCPNDTAKVVVNVQGCDYLGLEDVAFEGFNMYPNPTSDIVFISNSGSTEVFNYEVLDMNGRVILKANKAINGSTTTELDLSKVQVGVYMVRVFNENADKTFRVVKN